MCVSGLGRAVTDWSRVAAALSERGEVVAVELPGAGAGSGGLLASDRLLVERIARASPELPTVLVGHSIGAIVALLAAAGGDSELFSGMVLAAPFLPVGRNGRSRVATAADYARHPACCSLATPHVNAARARA